MMAGFHYANTVYPTIFDEVAANGKGAAPKQEVVNGETWICMRGGQKVILHCPTCDALNISLEFYCSEEGWTGLFSESSFNLWLMRDSGNECIMTLGQHNHDSSVRGTTFTQWTPGKKLKILLSYYRGNINVESNLCSGKASMGDFRDIKGIMISADGNVLTDKGAPELYFRNLIISTSPLSLSDVITEIPVKSVTGWDQTGDSYTVYNINSVATVSFDEDKIKDIEAKQKVSQFVFCGATDRTGDIIKNLNVDVAGKTFVRSIEYGARCLSAGIETAKIPHTVTMITKE